MPSFRAPSKSTRDSFCVIIGMIVGSALGAVAGTAVLHILDMPPAPMPIVQMVSDRVVHQ